MKKVFLLYSITIIVGGAFILGINYWTNATHRAPIQQSISTTYGDAGLATSTKIGASTVPAKEKKKSCACCADRMTRMKEHIQSARERKRRENGAEVKAPVGEANGKAK